MTWKSNKFVRIIVFFTFEFSFLTSAKILNLFYGDDQSDCPLPCSTISTETRLSNQQVGLAPGAIMVSFENTVEVKFGKFFCLFVPHNVLFFLKVTVTKMMKPTLATFLSEVMHC